jgi:hypothetical protein
MREDLKGLKGGLKQHWLRMHRPEVTEFLNKNGRESALVEYNLRPATLDRFLENIDKYIKLDKFSEADRMVLRLSQEKDRELAGRIRKLEEEMAEARPAISVVKALIAAASPTLETARLEVGRTPTPDDPLRITNLVESGNGKRRR